MLPSRYLKQRSNQVTRRSLPELMGVPDDDIIAPIEAEWSQWSIACLS